MGVRLGINGFGRVGKILLRGALQHPQIEMIAINHFSRRLQVNEKFYATLAHTLKYDSVHGIFPDDVQAGDGYILVNGRRVEVFSAAEPAKLPWGKYGVDVVAESSGKHLTRDAAAGHLLGGAKRVVITAPAKGDCTTIVMGVNEETYDRERDLVVSNASCTTNCLAPVAKVIHDSFGVVKGLMTTIHAYTNDQQILDMPYKDLRRGRAAALSIIPTTTGAARAVGLVLPELAGRLNGFAFRVPTPDVSVVDLTAEVKRPVTAEEVNGALKRAAEGELRGILGFCELPLVSVDFHGNPLSSIVDAQSTMVIDNMVKVVSWYDNEWGYTQRVLDLILYMAAQGL
ncbi:MAG TPA: type I glyceraldehyde-3-phosphate dehydrogenase [Spirochaetia bacterium]|nr:type I glyceraldehyde-3-phosphate dehydrogenase [Spirochaetia bacterium]